MLENYIYIKSKNAVFCYVPKVACTNWKCIFRYVEGYTDYLDAQLAHDRRNSGLIFLSDLHDGAQILRSNEVRKYSFVRDPYSRIVSAYRNKIEPFKTNSEKYPGEFWSDVYNIVSDELSEPHISFSQFLDWLRNSNHAYAKNEHWIPQYDILSPDKVKYNYIGKFENIEYDAQYILSDLCIDISFPTREQVHFPGTNSSSLVNQYCSKKDRKIIAKLYEQDFWSFNYAV